MANSRSSEKNVRQTAKRQARNQARKSALKTEIRKFQEAVRTGDAGKASQQFVSVTKKLDQTAAKGTLHRNTAARRKSRLAKRLNALKAGGAKSAS